MLHIQKPRPERSAGRCGSVAARLLVAALAIGSVAHVLSAQQLLPSQETALTRCTSTFSLEKRLVLEQWAGPAGCDRPVRSRVTDQFLGFTCVSEADVEVCRSFVPGAQSRAFDTAQAFRCVDLALTDVNGAIAILRMREWAAAPQQCNWDPGLGLLAMEVDFENRQICAAASCISVDRLTAIGKVRLMRLVTSALQGLDLIAQGPGPFAISPVRIDQH